MRVEGAYGFACTLSGVDTVGDSCSSSRCAGVMSEIKETPGRGLQGARGQMTLPGWSWHVGEM